MNFSLCLFSVVIFLSTGQFSFYLIRYAESYDSCLITFTGLVRRFSTFYSQYINVFLSYVRFHETSARTFLCFHRISYSETYLVNQGYLYLRLQLDWVIINHFVDYLSQKAYCWMFFFLSECISRQKFLFHPIQQPFSTKETH